MGFSTDDSSKCSFGQRKYHPKCQFAFYISSCLTSGRLLEVSG